MVGFYLMGLIAVFLVSLAGGPGTDQVYDVGQALGPLAIDGVPAGIAGGAGAALVR